VNLLLRVFSFLFLTPLTLFFLAMGAFALMQGVYNLNLDMLPWTGASLTWWVFGLSVYGLLSILLALRKKFRLLYALWALAVFVLTVNAVFLSGYRFYGPSEFYWAVGFCGVSLIAAAGAIMHARR
jgi:hypothetical protein